MPKYPHPCRRLIFDGIVLTPVDRNGAAGVWHVPGRDTATTEELFRLARRREVHAFLFEREPAI